MPSTTSEKKKQTHKSTHHTSCTGTLAARAVPHARTAMVQSTHTCWTAAVASSYPVRSGYGGPHCYIPSQMKKKRACAWCDSPCEHPHRRWHGDVADHWQQQAAMHGLRGDRNQCDSRIVRRKASVVSEELHGHPIHEYSHERDWQAKRHEVTVVPRILKEAFAVPVRAQRAVPDESAGGDETTCEHELHRDTNDCSVAPGRDKKHH